MEIVSRSARKTLNKLIKCSDENNIVDFRIHENLIEQNKLAISELESAGLVSTYRFSKVVIETNGLTFPARYKTKIYEYHLTGFWLPLVVSIISSLLINWILN